MTHTITLIPGDGIGPEVTEAVVRILAATGVSIDWEPHIAAGVLAFERTGPGAAGRAHRLDPPQQGRAQGAGDDADRRRVHERQRRACARRSISTRTCGRCGTCRASPRASSGVDLVIVRENTEDLYAGLEHEVVPGVVESLKIITERASTRIAQFAFEHARRHGRKKVTAIHKANIMKLSDGLFLDSVRRVAREYPTSPTTSGSSTRRACSW